MSGARVLWVDLSDGPGTAAVVDALVAVGASAEEVRAARHAVTAGGDGPEVDDGTAAPHDAWAALRTRLRGAGLDEAVARGADGALGRLSASGSRVPATVGTLAEVVALSAALASLSPIEVTVSSIGVGPMGAGPGTAGAPGETSRGGAPTVPTPLDLCLGRLVHASAQATAPAVVAAVAGEATSSGPLPAMLLQRTGTASGVVGGAVVAGGSASAVLGTRTDDQQEAGETVRLLEANVDDLDPRLWPGVLDALLAAGAADAWLTPVLMKKGRPAHTLHVLCAPASATALTDLVLERTTTLGVRVATLERTVLDRTFVDVDVDGVAIPVKVGHRGGRVLTVMPEFDAVTAAAAVLGASPRDVLDRAHAAARAVVRPGGPPPASGDVSVAQQRVLPDHDPLEAG